MDSKVYSVSEITQIIRNVLEDSFPVLWIEGEVSNYRPHHSGHLYFTLKDADAQISCVMWRSRASSVAMDLEDGQNVRIFGNLRLYEKAGRYQIDILSIEPVGIGDLQIRFEQLKKRLSEEGLFDPANKKSIPKYPQTVGIITSPTGAAIKDIISVITRRSPSTELILCGVKVQGIGAEREIKDGLDQLNAYGKVDVIILGRGGGSLEDLWSFNEEQVARAVFDSKIPVISAVGHEIDFTITDFVADIRAATPSAAAELAVPNDEDTRQSIINNYQIITNLISDRINFHREKLNGFLRAYAFRRPENIVNQYTQRLDEISYRLKMLATNTIISQRKKIEKYQDQFRVLHPEKVLQRGYSMTFKDGKLLSSINDIAINDEITVKLQDGSLKNKVVSKTND